MGNNRPENPPKPLFAPLVGPKNGHFRALEGQFGQPGAQLPIVEGVQLTWGLSNSNLVCLGLKRAEMSKKPVFRPFLDISQK